MTHPWSVCQSDFRSQVYGDTTLCHCTNGALGCEDTTFFPNVMNH